MKEDQIEISIKTADTISKENLELFINNTPVEFTVDYQHIEILWPKKFGIHQLKLTSNSSKKINIEQVSIDHCDLRKLLHLSWTIDNFDNRLQPSTELCEGQHWILPFGYPVSHWLVLNSNKFRNNMYGQNLVEKYWHWYPESIELPNSFPQTIRDFFQYNFDYTTVDKTCYTSADIPYMKYPGEISKVLLDQSIEEITQHMDIMTQEGNNYGTFAGNQQEYKIHNDEAWKILWLLKSDGSKKFVNEFPSIWKLVESLKVDFISVFIGTLPPGGLIYPHVDDVNLTNPDYKNYNGCTQIYIPLKWPKGNYIKLANAGVLDLVDGPMVINTQYFAHAVVNNSDEYRHVLGIRTNVADIFDRCCPADQ